MASWPWSHRNHPDLPPSSSGWFFICSSFARHEHKNTKMSIFNSIFAIFLQKWHLTNSFLTVCLFAWYSSNGAGCRCSSPLLFSHRYSLYETICLPELMYLLSCTWPFMFLETSSRILSNDTPGSRQIAAEAFFYRTVAGSPAADPNQPV